MNDHGAATLRGENGSTYHVTSYEDPTLRSALEQCRTADRVRVEMERAGVRANVWHVTGLYPGADSGALQQIR
ncbi:hypothetical protein ACFQJC_02740 [Haloferax namakaokahaiae]|uniref:DUF7999 domain-containing protein n=1 Tax=Haloferax namakaokahaiae TaxID=1748331 RepID=A0ABD5ZB31_9EURY